MDTNALIKKLGLETIYSAKGHFKSADLRRNLTTITIWSCAAFNIIGIIGINTIGDKLLSAVGLFGTIALLIWNEGDGKNYKAKHKEIGEQYLAIHKEIRECYFVGNCTADEVKELSKKVSGLDKIEKPDIPGLARRLAKRAIEKKDKEIDDWFN